MGRGFSEVAGEFGVRLDLGCGRYPAAGFTGVDKFSVVNPDIVCDFEVEQLPFDDGTVSEIRASQVFEHISDLNTVMTECHRLLAKTGKLVIEVPYWSSEGAFRDPTHVRFFSEKSFEYWKPESECAYYAGCAPFKVLTVEYLLHPSWLVKITRKLFGIRFLKAFNNCIIGLRFELAPIK